MSIGFETIDDWVRCAPLFRNIKEWWRHLPLVNNNAVKFLPIRVYDTRARNNLVTYDYKLMFKQELGEIERAQLVSTKKYVNHIRVYIKSCDGSFIEPRLTRDCYSEPPVICTATGAKMPD